MLDSLQKKESKYSENTDANFWAVDWQECKKILFLDSEIPEE